MKKVLALILLVLLMCSLAACGNEKFTCSLCMNEVKSKKHTTEVYGQKMDICDECYKQLEELSSYLGN